MLDPNTPLWKLTVGEFLTLAKNVETPTVIHTHSEKYVYGIDGLAKLLKCSRSTATRLKSSGKLDKAIKQQGRKIIVDAELAIKLFSN